MPRVVFTSHLQMHLSCEAAEVAGLTVAEALTAVFQGRPEMRSYLLDDQGRVRQHVMIFVNDAPLADRERLSNALTPHSEIYVMQALSGG